MARLTEIEAAEQAKECCYKEPVELSPQIQASWLDYLPQTKDCALPQLFRAGLPLDQVLEIVGIKEHVLSKSCKKSCSCSVAECCKRWADATKAMVLVKQADKAAGGSDAMLQWYGKAVLRQTEPVEVAEEIVPSVINIVGLKAEQEKEIESLRAQIKALKAGNTVEDTTVVEATRSIE